MFTAVSLFIRVYTYWTAVTSLLICLKDQIFRALCILKILRSERFGGRPGWRNSGNYRVYFFLGSEANLRGTIFISICNIFM